MTENGSSYPGEMKFMETFEHPNLVKVLAVYRERYPKWPYDRHGFTWMELAQCDLHYKIKETMNHGLQEEIAQRYMRDVVQGLNYLYNNSIAHRDIEPNNILISMNDVAMLTDFGCIKEIHRSQKSNQICGTTTYHSPVTTAQA